MDSQETKTPTADELLADATAEEKPAKQKRGFAIMDPEKRREIARRGGRAVHDQGKAHHFTHEQAVDAGRKGGAAAHVVRGRKRPQAA
ncbi:MAG TPA: KGG domain-containing protein [Labilithrix sp.]|jgi:general stress protein YciG